MATINLGTGTTGGGSLGITGLSGDVTSGTVVGGIAPTTVNSVAGNPFTASPTPYSIVQRDATGTSEFATLVANEMFLATQATSPLAAARLDQLMAVVESNSLAFYNANGIELNNNLVDITTTDWRGYVLSDGHVVAAGDYILLTAQTDTTQNIMWYCNVTTGFFEYFPGWEIGDQIVSYRIPVIDYTNLSNRDGWIYLQTAKVTIGTIGEIPVYKVVGKGNILHPDNITIVQPSGSVISVGQIFASNLSTGCVTTNAILDENITAIKMATDSVGEAALQANTVSTPKLVDASVTEVKIGSGAVTSGKIGALAVGTSAIDNNAVSLGKLTTAVQNRLIPATGSTASTYLSGLNTYLPIVTNGGIGNANTVLIADATGTYVQSSTLSMTEYMRQNMATLNKQARYILGGTPSPNTVGFGSTPFIVSMFSFTPQVNTGIVTTVSGTTNAWSIVIPATTTTKIVEIEASIAIFFGGGSDQGVAFAEFGFSSTGGTTYTYLPGSNVAMLPNFGYPYLSVYSRNYQNYATYRYTGTAGATIYLQYTGFSEYNGSSNTTITIANYTTASRVASFLKITEIG